MGDQTDMQPFFERADGFAQNVVNAWSMNASAGDAKLLTPEFKALFELAMAYRTARNTANNRRQFNMLSEMESLSETNTFHKFVEAYKGFERQHAKVS